MDIKKSIISGIVMLVGTGILAVLAVLYCFTDIPVSGTGCMIIWTGCILAMAEMSGRIEKK